MAQQTVYKFNADEEKLIPGRAPSNESIEEANSSGLLQQPVIIQSRENNKKWKKSYVIGITAAVLIVVMAMALVLVVVYGPLANNLNQESSTLESDFKSFKTQYESETESLRAEFQQRIRELTYALNETKEKLSDAEERISLLSDSLVTIQDNSIALNTVTHSNTEMLNNMQEAINNIASNGTVSASQLEAVRSQIRSQYDSLQTVVNSLNTAQHSTTTQVHALSTRINTPVNIYQNCSEESRSCTFSTSSYQYVKYCSTSSLPVNATDKYTVDTRCEYSQASSSSSYFWTAVIQRSSSGVYCRCGVTYLSGSSHSYFYNSVSATCYLKIKRCGATILH